VRARCLTLLCLTLLLGGVGRAPAAEAPLVSVWVTTADGSRLLQAEPPIALVPEADIAPAEVTIDVDDSRRYQTMTGFGATLTDSSAWLIGTALTPEQRGDLMRALFDPVAGIGLSYLRHSIGATDFSLSNYTYDDMPPGESDPTLAHFSIEHDRAYILPIFKEARQLNPALAIMGTPWSAPAWMKTSGALIGGSLRPDAYGPYAHYLVRFLEAYAAEGVPVQSITPENEPLHEPAGYPGMLMSAAEQAAFIRDHLGPALANAGLSTEIYIYDHNWDRPDYPMEILSDPAARAYVTGTAFHCYAGNVSSQLTVHDAFPDKAIMVSECTGLVGSMFGSDLRWLMHNLFIGATRRWATSVLMWNLALDQDSGPQNGGCPICRGVVTIDRETGAVTYNVEYYALGHASLAARSGATRIESTSIEASIETVAFLNPAGSKGLLVLNSAATDVTFNVRWSGLAFSSTLPADAVATYTWP
jgi:glucosylceramidase